MTVTNIIAKYFDKRQATVQAIQDYDSMKFIIENTDQRIKEEYQKMGLVSSPQFGGIPHEFNPNSNEEKLMDRIEQIDVLRNRYLQAQEYMSWFQPAWDELDKEERFCLEQFYMGSELTQSCARFTVADEYHVDESSAYRKKNRALSHMQLLLFGKD